VRRDNEKKEKENEKSKRATGNNGRRRSNTESRSAKQKAGNKTRTLLLKQKAGNIRQEHFLPVSASISVMKCCTLATCAVPASRLLLM
jgi:hypothetical protein